MLKLNTLLPCFLLLLCVIIYQSCTKIDNTVLGLGIVNGLDGILTKDTILEVETQTVEDLDTARIVAYNYLDSANLFPSITSDNMVIGNIYDPQFGSTNAQLFFELSPPFFPYYITGTPDSIRVDSAVLILSCNSIYGDTAKSMNIRVYEIDKNSNIDPSIIYPSNYPALSNLVKGNLIGMVNNLDLTTINDSVNNRFENTTNQIRIKLSNAVADKFIKQYDSFYTYNNITNYRTQVKGFYVETSGGNALLNLSLNSSNTKLALYYNSSTTGATKRDTSVANFTYVFNRTIGAANFVKNDRSGSEILQHLNKPNDSLVYVQTSPGTKVNIQIKGLKNFPNKIIHRAELLASAAPDPINFANVFNLITPPNYILLYVYDSVNKLNRTIPKDFVLSQSIGYSILSTNSGILNYVSTPEYSALPTYTFNITRYFQGIVNKKDSLYSFRMVAPGNFNLNFRTIQNGTEYPILIKPTDANTHGNGRVRLGGGNHSKYKMKVRVVYSNLN